MLSRSLKIGIVCPYSWDTPGGVQNHIRDLAEFLIESGHDVSVLAPVIDESNLPEYVVNAGKPISIPYNGAVARVLFGPVAFARVRQWISQGEFDLLHLHEPAIPSISLLACWAADGPMVGTFHAAAKRQKIIFAIGPILEPAIEKLSARIAVSEAARLTLTDHLDTDAVIIPNGIYANRYTDGKTIEKWSGNTIGFIGRFEEPRKGLSVLVDALPVISRFAPDVKIFVAGPGDPAEVIEGIDPQLRQRFEFLGKITESEKADFMSSVAVYVAPNTGGESFGIILAEALAGGACVVASDIPAFDDLLGHGEFGALFESESSTELAKVVIDLLRDQTKRKELSARGKERSKMFDWTVVAQQIYSVYEMSIVGSQKVRLASDTRPWNRFLSKEEKQ
jgi:phosphatidyl-myo-inositol alpha-mannosyltransferase